MSSVFSKKLNQKEQTVKFSLAAEVKYPLVAFLFDLRVFKAPEGKLVL